MSKSPVVFVSLLITLLTALGIPGAVNASDAPPNLRYALSSCWGMQENSGVRYDAAGANNLSDNNTVNRVLMPQSHLGFAAKSIRQNTERLVSTTSAEMLSEHISIVGWVAGSTNADALIINKSGSWFLSFPDASRIRLYTYVSAVATTTNANVTPGAWSFFAARITSTQQQLRINNLADVTTNRSGALDAGTSTLTLLENNASAPSTAWVAGAHIAVWLRGLTDNEIDWLYNAGQGRTCAEILAADGSTPPPAIYTDTALDDDSAYRITRNFDYGDMVTFGGLLFLTSAIVLFNFADWAQKWTK